MIGRKHILGVGARRNEPCPDPRAPKFQRKEDAYDLLEPPRIGEIARLRSSESTVMEDQELQRFAVPVEGKEGDERSYLTCAESMTCAWEIVIFQDPSAPPGA